MHIPSILAAVLVLHAATVTASTTVKSSKPPKCQCCPGDAEMRCIADQDTLQRSDDPCEKGGPCCRDECPTTMEKGETCQFSNCQKGLYCGIADGGKPVGADGSGVCIEIPKKECYDFDFHYACENDGAYCNPINETDHSLNMKVKCPLSCGKPKCDTTTDGAEQPSHASLVELLIGAILTWAVGHVAFVNGQ